MAGAPDGNDNALKYDTLAKRKKLLSAYKKHCELGYPDDMFEECDIRTFKKYCKDYPIELPADIIHRSQMKRAKILYDIGVRGTVGIPMSYTDPRTNAKSQGKSFNAKSWQFIMMNLLNWKTRDDHTTKDEKLPKHGFMVYRPEKLPNDYDEKMNKPTGAGDATTSTGGATSGSQPPAPTA